MDSQQNNIAYITGVSSGIGEALAKHLLSIGYAVYGIGRSSSIQHHNYQFLELDLNDTPRVEQFKFNSHSDANLVLVNNAGMLGDILPVGTINSNQFADIMTVNTIAPQILINAFIRSLLDSNEQLHVLNISSGAGKRPIDAWATYCASKAALDLFSETVKLEMELREIRNFFIHCVAPGVVDTKMQNRIREASPENFKMSQRFHDLKTNNELVSVDLIAFLLTKLIQNPQKYPINILAANEIGD